MAPVLQLLKLPDLGAAAPFSSAWLLEGLEKELPITGAAVAPYQAASDPQAARRAQTSGFGDRAFTLLDARRPEQLLQDRC